MIEIRVALGDHSYPVLVGDGARHRLCEVLPSGVQRVAIVTQGAIDVHCDPGVPSEVLTVDEGEGAKTLESVEELCRAFTNIGLTRRDCVVAVGGGMVTDLAGFAAAVYHRGIPVVHVATTLLAQVDAAIGGKTGVNLPEGKNLVGAFWQPTAVLCDTSVLATLPAREYLSGTGEMAKYHFIGAQLGIDTDVMFDEPLERRVARCVEIKARVVSADEREGGLRAILNYGHTLAHALEIAGRFDIRHGEAVAVGVHFAALLAHRLGRIDHERIDDHMRVLRAYSLPTTLPSGAGTNELITLMRRDKKARWLGGVSPSTPDGLMFVLDGPTGVEPVRVDESDVEATLEEMSGE